MKKVGEESNEMTPSIVDDADLKIIKNSPYFDEAWYVDQYKDVAISGMDPALHFLRFGALLKRSPGPEFNTRFYQSTYVDAVGSSVNPLLVHHSAVDVERRPTTLGDAQKVSLQMDGATNPGGTYSSQDEILVSYCIPIAGRLDDLKSTLRINLDANADYIDKIEFLIAELGIPGEVSVWLEKNFPDELKSGYLRVVSENERLDGWHFGRAKNSFKSHMRGNIYSSLDGDNFVTAEETAMLLSVADEHRFGFVMHHFSGHWGDGTSGRVSMPGWLYRAAGYDETLMPRQFDEMDLILGALKLCPAVPFVGISSKRNTFTLSKNAMNFYVEQKLPNRKIFVGDCKRRSPLNPRGANYAEIESHLQHMNNFNAALSAFRRGSIPEIKGRYLSEIAKHKHRLIETIPADRVLSTFFETKNGRPIFSAGQEDICLVACLHDECTFLKDFVSHYRRLGVTRFLFVDDGSKIPVSELSLGNDVFAYRPKVGDFRSSKTLWMEGLLKAAGAERGWAIAADADEFLQLPAGYNSLREVIQELEEKGLNFASALLLDMVPNPERPFQGLDSEGLHYTELLDHFVDVQTAFTDEYANTRSIQWAFGPHAQLSWRFDTRYHIFGTFDCLRKFPLFKPFANRHLNQGFHTFHFEDGSPGITPEVWKNTPVLPIYHYKLVKLFSEAAREKMLEKSKGYHERTSGNIERIFTSGSTELMDRLSEIKHFLKPAAAATEPGLFKVL